MQPWHRRTQPWRLWGARGACGSARAAAEGLGLRLSQGPSLRAGLGQGGPGSTGGSPTLVTLAQLFLTSSRPAEAGG